MVYTALITIVISLAPGRQNGSLEVITKDGKFSIADSIQGYSVFYKTLQGSIKNAGFVTILYDQSSAEINFVFSITKDWVKEITDDSSNLNRTVITLIMRPTRVYLEKANPKYAEILSVLRNSQAKNIATIIGIHPVTTCIEAVKIIE